MLGVVCRGAHSLHDVRRGAVEVGLEQTGHAARQDGARERGARRKLEHAHAPGGRHLAAHGHHVGLDAAVRRRSYRRESRVEPLTIYRADGQDVVRIGRETNLLPFLVAAVARAVHHDEAAAGRQRCRPAVDVRAAVQFGVAVRARVVVEGGVAQRRTDDVGSCAVGILHGGAPVVLLDELLGAAVLAYQQHVVRLGRRAHEDMRQVCRQAREHHRAVVLLHLGDAAVGHDEVSRRHDACAAQGGDAVGVVEAAVDDGNRHPLSAETAAMQIVRANLSHLCGGIAIDVLALHALVGVEDGRETICHIHAVGADIDAAHVLNELHAVQAVQQRRVGHLDHRRVVPPAGADNAQALAPQEVEIDPRHGQVVGIDAYPEAFAARQRLGREEGGGARHAVTVVALVAESHAVHIGLGQRLLVRLHIIHNGLRQPVAQIGVLGPGGQGRGEEERRAEQGGKGAENVADRHRLWG